MEKGRAFIEKGYGFCFKAPNKNNKSFILMAVFKAFWISIIFFA